MDPSPHVNLDINVRNLPQSAVRRSTVAMKVERLVNEYMATPNGEPTLTSSYHSCPPELFDFEITSTTRVSQILEILHTQLDLSLELSLSVASAIFCKAINMYLGRNAIFMNVVVQISYDAVLDIDVLDFLTSGGGEASEEENNDDLVENFVRDCVIGEKLGLEKESCSICLEDLLEVSKKVPTRMPCSHLFHDQCIAQWLRRKESCPICRRVVLER